MSSTCAVEQKPEPQQLKAPSSLITLGRYYDFKSSVSPWAGWGVSASKCAPFSAVLSQMRARVSEDDPPSQSCSIMNSLRPANRPAHAELLASESHLGQFTPPLVFCSPARGQGLGSSLPLQTKSLMARNSWDAFHKSCRFANCMRFRLVGQNSWERHSVLHFIWAC